GDHNYRDGPPVGQADDFGRPGYHDHIAPPGKVPGVLHYDAVAIQKQGGTRRCECAARRPDPHAWSRVKTTLGRESIDRAHAPAGSASRRSTIRATNPNS